MIVLDVRLHRALVRHAGDWAAARQPRACDIDLHRDLRGGSAVYIACDAHDHVLYVGSVHRPGDDSGLACRIGEHLRDAGKRLRWRRLWVVSLSADVPLAVVRDVEAIVGADLNPPWNGRLPILIR
jgi:hypothetical protein